MWSRLVSHFQLRLYNLRVNDLTLLCNSRPILTVEGMSPLFEELFDIFVKYKCFASIMVRDFVSIRSIKLINGWKCSD